MTEAAGEMSAMPKAAKTPVAKAPLHAGDHLILVDGSGFIFRAFHALPPLTRKSDNLPVGAVAGFSNMIWKMLQEGPSPEKGLMSRRISPSSSTIRRRRSVATSIPTTRRTGRSRLPT